MGVVIPLAPSPLLPRHSPERRFLPQYLTRRSTFITQRRKKFLEHKGKTLPHNNTFRLHAFNPAFICLFVFPRFPV